MHPSVSLLARSPSERRLRTFAGLAGTSRRGSLAPCTPSSPYDGHVCVFREPAGLAGFSRLLGVE